MSAKLLYSIIHGDFWRGYCDDCTWNSKNRLLKTRGQAEQAVDMHKIVCKGGKTYGGINVQRHV